MDPCCVDPCSPECKSIGEKCEAECEGFGGDNPCCPPGDCNPDCGSVGAKCEGGCDGYGAGHACCPPGDCDSACDEAAAQCEGGCPGNPCDDDDPDDDEDDPDPDCDGAADKGDGLFVRLATGNIWTTVPILQTFADDEVELDLKLRYDAQRAGQDGPVGYGWTHSYNLRLETLVGKVIFWQGNGRRNAFVWDPQTGTYMPPKGRAFDLVWVNDHYEVHQPDGTRHVFDSAYRLSQTIDRRGRTMRFTYGTNGRLATILSPHGRAVTFDYDGVNRLWHVTGPDGKQTTFAYDPTGNLTNITDPLGHTLNYQYDGAHRLTRETLKNGTFYTAEYQAQWCILRDGQGHVVVGVSPTMPTINFPPTRRGPIKPGGVYYVDGRGLSWLIQRDNLGRLRRITAPNGTTRKYTYGGTGAGAARNRLVRIDNERGYARTFQWDAWGNVIQRTDEAGHEEQLAYQHSTIRSLLTTRTEPDSDQWDFTYDANGDLLEIEDPLNEHDQGAPADAVIHFDYESYGEMEDVGTAGLPLPGRIRWVTMTDRNGHDTLFDYDARGNLATVTRGAGPLNLVTRYEYDAVGRRTRATIERGDRDVFADWIYDDAGRLVKTVVDTNGLDLTESRVCDEHGNLVRLTDPRGIPTRFDYDQRNRLTGRTQAEGTLDLTTVWDLDGNGNVVLRTDPEGNVTSNGYNGQNFLVDHLDAEGYRTSLARDGAGNLTRVDRTLNPGPDGPYASVGYVYDALNRLTSRSLAPDSLNLTTAYEYTAPGGCACATPGRSLPHKIVDAAGKGTYFNYDKLDRRVCVVRKVGDAADNGCANDGNDLVIGYAYDPQSNLKTVFGPEGERVEFGYDEADRRTTVMAIDTNGPDLVTTLVYDGADQVTFAALPNGNVIELAYDAANRLSTASDLVGPIAGLGYDPNGNVARREDGLGQAWIYAYDEADRLREVRDPIVETPDDLFTTFTYDPVARVVQRTNPLGVRTRYEYDRLGRLGRVLEDYQGVPGSGTADTATVYGYDGRGRVVSLTDHDGNTTTYAYDAAGRVSRVIYPDNEAVSSNGIMWFTWTPAGRVESRTDQKGVVTTYSYDDLHRLTGRSYGDGVTPADGFGYDQTGRLTRATNAVGERRLGYDDLGRLERVEQELAGLAGGTYVTTFAYQVDPSDVRRTLVYPGGRVVTENYDLRYRLDSVTSPGLGTVADWSYDAADRRETAVLGNGIGSTFAYDLVGRLSSIRHAKDAVDLFHVEHGYDAAGDRLWRQDLLHTNRGEKYVHDARERVSSLRRGTLTAEHTIPPGNMLLDPVLPGRQSWTLDRRGNWGILVTAINGQPITQARTPNAVNEVLTIDPDGSGAGVPPVALTYDDDGDLALDPTAWNAGDPPGGSPSGRRYGYDARNRLTGVWNMTGTAEPGDDSLLLTLGYDALSSRVRSTDAGGAATFHLSGAGPGVLEERQGDGTLLREFVYGRDFLEPLVLVTHGGPTGGVGGPSVPPGEAAFYYLQDVLRSVVALTNSNGEVVERYTYDPYGTTYVTDQSAFPIPQSAIGNPFAWTGQRFDSFDLGPGGRRLWSSTPGFVRVALRPSCQSANKFGCSSRSEAGSSKNTSMGPGARKPWP